MTVDLTLFYRKKITLLLCTLSGLMVGFIYLWAVPSTHQAQARVLIEPKGVTPESAPTGRVDPEFLPTQAETIRSPITIERALASVEITPPLGADLEEFDQVRHVVESLRVTPVLKANVLTMAYRSTDSEEAVDVISAIIAAYRQHVTELDRGTSKTDVQMVATRERALREELTAAQDQYEALRSESPLLGHGREASAEALTELNRIAAQVSVTRQQQTELAARLATISTAPDRRLIQVLHYADPVDAKAIQDIEEKLRFANLRIDQLDGTYGSRHPALISARAERLELEALLQQRLEDAVQAWQRQLQILETTANQLQDSYNAERKEIKNTEVYLLKEETFKANLARIEQLHSGTLAQLLRMQAAEEAIAGGRSSIEVRVLDGPALMDDLMWPKPKLLLAASACLGFVGGFCLIWVQESSASSVSITSESSPSNSTASNNGHVIRNGSPVGNCNKLVGEIL